MMSTKLTIEGRHYHMDDNMYGHELSRLDKDNKKLIKARREDDFDYAVLCYEVNKA